MRIIFFILFVNLSLIVSATGLYGGQITYKHLGGNIYEFELIQFYDSQAPAATQANLQYTSGNCGSGTITLSRTSLAPNSNNCGPYLSSIATYTGTKTFQGSCSMINLSYTNCCKGSVDNLMNSFNLSTRIEVDIIDSIGRNSSPVFNGIPIIQISKNQTAQLNFTATDTDGDSLVYQFSPIPNATYPASFSATNPFGNQLITLNQFTGSISVTAPNSGLYAFVVEVLEYRNNILLGKTKREVSIFINQNPNNNQNPAISGVNGTAVYAASSCSGDTLQFYALVSDPNMNQVAVSLGNPSFGATYVVSNDTVYVNWVIDSALVSSHTYPLVFNLDDGNCGIINQVFSFKINSCITTGVLQNEIPSFFLYPNPASEFVSISSRQEILGLRVYNLSGSEMNSINYKTSEQKINVSALANGIYFIKLETIKGFIIKKLVVTN